MTDLAFVGPLYTWWNKRDNDPVGKNLDQAIINGDWMNCFPHFFATFEAVGISDRIRCLIRLSQQIVGNRRPFQLFNYLVDHVQFLPLVTNIWNQSPPLFHSRSALQLFHRKLKHELQALNRTHYANIPTRTKAAYEELCHCQEHALTTLDVISFEVVDDASNRWHHLCVLRNNLFDKNQEFSGCIRWIRTLPSFIA